MSKKLFKLEALGFIFVSILGALSHFFYDWSNESKFIALFSPVNESPWEHLKLLFFPFVIFSIFSSIKLKMDKFNVFSSAYISIVIGMWTTLSYYYTFSGALGGNEEWINLSSFFVGILIAFIINYFLLNHSIGKGLSNGIGLAMIVITTVVFVLFNFEPPLIPLFQDPQNLTFGI